ncbi:hypothetical protein GCM10010508_24660 [Streptomyces naganishii JCM 4654]|uniref:Uncharacterized protein n=1 Tax=Streptomyces naganishii JCM 4654 TaxID=1306179 RepID=A0A918Y3H0_9ACTN|nr:hypothetical protein GCM10010508_24660 [Streptomyces naganishii JCM 4654]
MRVAALVFTRAVYAAKAWRVVDGRRDLAGACRDPRTRAWPGPARVAAADAFGRT